MLRWAKEEAKESCTPSFKAFKEGLGEIHLKKFDSKYKFQ